MRILLDECVNPRLREAFVGHEVTTVAEVKWRTIRDDRLLVLAGAQFDVFVTIDRGFAHQHNLAKIAFGIVLIRVAKNRMEYYRPLFDELRGAVNAVRPGQLIVVDGSQ